MVFLADVFNYFYCSICWCDLLSVASLTVHVRGKQHIVKVARTKLERARRARLGTVWTRRATTARLGRTRERTPPSLCPVVTIIPARYIPSAGWRDDNPGGIGTSQPIVVTIHDDDSDDTVDWDWGANPVESDKSV